MAGRLLDERPGALVLASVAELRHGNGSALSVGHLSCLRLLAVGLACVFVGHLVAGAVLTDCVWHYLPSAGHTGAVETLSDGLGVEVPLSLLKAVTEAAMPVASTVVRAACTHVFLVHSFMGD